MRVAQLRVLGGAMARVPADATAYAHRSEPDHGQRRGASTRARTTGPCARHGSPSSSAALHQGDAGAYVNFLGDEGEARVRAAYPGTTWDRLSVIKGRYDPTNLFRLNQNIPPTPEA